MNENQTSAIKATKSKSEGRIIDMLDRELMNIMVVVKQLVKNYHEKFNILQVP
jgi:hypothetical protein